MVMMMMMMMDTAFVSVVGEPTVGDGGETKHVQNGSRAAAARCCSYDGSACHGMEVTFWAASHTKEAKALLTWCTNLQRAQVREVDFHVSVFRNQDGRARSRLSVASGFFEPPSCVGTHADVSSCRQLSQHIVLHDIHGALGFQSNREVTRPQE